MAVCGLFPLDNSTDSLLCFQPLSTREKPADNNYYYHDDQMQVFYTYINSRFPVE